jgi:ABC-type antimicrobial peptide transport system permease subunit
VVSEAAARTFWPGETVTDKRIGFNVDTVGLPVVGEVNDSRQASLATAPAPVIYVSMQRYVQLFRTMTLVVRGRGDVAGTVGTIRDVVRGLDANLPLSNVQTLQDIVDASTAQARLNMTLLGVFAVVALLLATLGIYGVISYSVTERQQEIGIRVALGARAGDVLRLVVGEGAALALVGIVVGVAGAALATRLIQSWLFGIGRTDAATFAVVVLGMLGVALVASYIPARRAARVDPLRAIRAE